MKYLSSILILASTLAFGQTDPEAKAILDESIAKWQNMEAVEIQFNYSLENVDAGVEESHDGSALLKGDKYSVKVMGYHQISDSKTLWTVSPEMGEVMISSLDDLEGGFSPSSLLNLYETGMKVSMGETKTVNGKKVQSIILYPSSTNDKAYHRIEVGIDASNNDLVYAYEYGKNGTTTGYLIKSLKEAKGLDQKLFTLKGYPEYANYESVDLR